MQVDPGRQRELAYRLWEERGRPEGRPFVILSIGEA